MHFLVIGFNISGWIWNRFLKLHLACIIATAFSWLVLGIWYGWGYCFLTDWHWAVKRKLGETDLPASFISYMVEKINIIALSATAIDGITAITFVVAAGISVYKNLKTNK